MHFMNPVPIMKLVELAKGQHTSQQTFEACKGLAQFLGKEVATSQDRPGFLVNRVLIPMINEAFFCLMEVAISAAAAAGIASATAAAVLSTGFLSAEIINSDSRVGGCQPVASNGSSSKNGRGNVLLGASGCVATYYKHLDKLNTNHCLLALCCPCRVLAQQRTLTRACG
eukprot:GHRR01003395.1.p1 GENE.GHRR01003395.1~~GHRR01003395.1.p1  ORF type:complete len:170 (+),score=61.21 GHRR01003395.1:2613-3122(+)